MDTAPTAQTLDRFFGGSPAEAPDANGKKRSWRRPDALSEKPTDPPSSPAKKRKKAKASKIAGKTLEQHRRAMGDRVKAKISVEKWCIEARTQATISGVEPEVFEQLIAANAVQCVPKWDRAADHEVVVAHMQGTESLANAFGATKIKGGTRMGSWSANKADCIYFPRNKQMRVWWTMSW